MHPVVRDGDRTMHGTNVPKPGRMDGAVPSGTLLRTNGIEAGPLARLLGPGADDGDRRRPQATHARISITDIMTGSEEIIYTSLLSHIS